MINNFYGNARYPNVSGPGQWQDPDMLVVGMEVRTAYMHIDVYVYVGIQFHFLPLPSSLSVHTLLFFFFCLDFNYNCRSDNALIIFFSLSPALSPSFTH